MLRVASDTPEEEQRLVEQLNQWLSRGEKFVQVLLDELPSLEPGLQRRALRGLGGLIERSQASFFEITISSDPTVIYYLIHSCMSSSDPEARELLREFSEHDVEWVAAKALETLAVTPENNDSFIRDRLRNERRQTVLIGLLKSLYRNLETSLFAQELQALVESNCREQISFYAAVLLKKSSPEVFEGLVNQSRYLQKINAQVDVGTTVEPGEE
ncbi:MAG: hypothetical protein ABEK50_04495 [bacterium]